MASKELWQLQRILTELETAYAQPGMPKLSYSFIQAEVENLIQEKMRADVRARLEDLDVSSLRTLEELVLSVHLSQAPPMVPPELKDVTSWDDEGPQVTLSEPPPIVKKRTRKPKGD
jgi:hypothetical protein